MIRRTPLSLGLLLALSACAVGPDFQRPAAPAGAGYTPETPADPIATANPVAGSPQHFDIARDLPGEWWALYHSDTLDALVKRALAANPDLDAAQAALHQAQENLYAGQGSFFPTASASFQPERERIN